MFASISLHLAAWTFWLIGWIFWGLYFAVEEAMALRKTHTAETDGTLSSMVWRLVRGRAWYHRVAWALVGIGMGVLTWHFLFQIPY